MDLYKEILINVLQNEDIHITFPNLQVSAKEIVEMECYRALQKIKAIIEDDRLADETCFERIEAIVCLFELMGSGGGSRHDFG